MFKQMPNIRCSRAFQHLAVAVEYLWDKASALNVDGSLVAAFHIYAIGDFAKRNETVHTNCEELYIINDLMNQSKCGTSAGKWHQERWTTAKRWN